tara:strand:+ start:122 stop:319 length:198 start_codon:yes stop_codon:yes gene_type:complete
MKVTASISVSIKLKDNEDPDSAHDRVVEKLVEVCDEWIDGEGLPRIIIKYELEPKEFPIPKEIPN